MEKNVKEAFKDVVNGLLEEGATYDEIFDIIRLVRSDNRLMAIVNEFGWEGVSKENLPAYFIRQHKDKLNWKEVSLHTYFSEEELDEFAEYLDWFIIFQKHHLSGDMLHRQQGRIKVAIVNAINELQVKSLQNIDNYLVGNVLIDHRRESEE